MNNKLSKDQIIDFFKPLMSNFPGIRGFITYQYGSDILFERLAEIEDNPITKVQFDQLLTIQKIYSVSDGFFKYYWLHNPKHFYALKDFDFSTIQNNVISSLEQLKWGLERVFIDCLYLFGNIDIGFRELTKLTEKELVDCFNSQMFDTNMIASRGKTLDFYEVDRSDRYLISEMACKTLGDGTLSEDNLTKLLLDEYEKAIKAGIKNPKYKDLLRGAYSKDKEAEQMSLFTLTDILELTVDSNDDIVKNARSIASRYIAARDAAIKNTKMFLSLVNDLDVYVATSMRTKENFLAMSDFCTEVFKSEHLKEFDLRYFDPTISATSSHEDKGLIECLMVKAARMLIYHSGDRDSYGKDAEAAMALCLGKPVIFYCGEDQSKLNFFKTVHPLSRLVNFENGVANGIIVCGSSHEVAIIIRRLVTNQMKYKLVQKQGAQGYYTLLEEMTGSVVRVHTNDQDLTTAFWNFYRRNRT